MVVKPKKKEVEACFTCPLCTNLFDHATTISECLHTFCRNCIEDKLITERLRACPICNVDLGVAPLDKLRADYSWEDMRLKLFPRKQESVKPGPENVAVSLKPSKKKEKSLSALLASSSRVSFSPDLNQDAPLEANVPVVEKLSEKVEAVPQIQSSSKPIITFRKRQRKTSRPKKNDIGLESEQPRKETAPSFQFDLNTIPDCGLAEASTSQGYIQKENNSEKDKEVATLNINDTPPVIVEPEPAITPNGRENQDYVLISGGRSEECVEVIHNKSFVNSGGETEKVPVEVNQNFVLISSERDTEKASGKKVLMNNGEGNQEYATSSSGKVSGETLKNKGKGIQEYTTSSSEKVSGEKLMNNGKGIQEYATSSSEKVSGETLKNKGKGIQEYTTSSSEKASGEKQKNNGKGIQEYATSSSGKVSGKKLRNNGKGNQECHTPKSGKVSAKKLKDKNYSPPVLRPRIRGRAMSSAASTSGAGVSLVAENNVQGRQIPVWFSLIASTEHNPDRPLPQLSASFLRVHERNMTVSYVKKYLVQKLSLQSEDEVEIWLRQEPVCSTQTLHSLVDWWVQTTPIEERKSVMVGSSAAEFIMVLHYSLKVTTVLSDSE